MTDTAKAQLLAWALADEAALYQIFKTSAAGLSHNEAGLRLLRTGPNSVAQSQAQRWPQLVLARLRNPLHALLLLLAGVSWAMGDRQASLVIAAMVSLSVTLGVWQEHRSHNAALALKTMVHTTASVLRPPDETLSRLERAPRDLELGGSHLHEVPLQDLVPGDIVHLSAGDMVPADVVLLSSKNLYVNESALTGESMPADKDAHAANEARLCWMGSSVVSGSALAMVALTGARTTFGALAALSTAQRAPSSFDVGLNRFAWLMIRFIAIMAPLVFVINGLSKGNWLDALLFAMAVAVGLTPEMLPMIVTVNLAKGALVLSRRQVIVKHLQAIQNFGAMDVLCTDKTGTLTQDRVILQRHINLQGQPSDEVLMLAYLNSTYQSGLKNLLDASVLSTYARHPHHDLAWQKMDELPFDFTRKRMSVVVSGGHVPPGQALLICKGAVDSVLCVCTHGRDGDSTFVLDESHRAKLLATTNALNAEGLRLIAVATKSVASCREETVLRDEFDLVLEGYIAFLDPPKDSAAHAIAQLQHHGIAVKVLTGDNLVVTRHIAQAVGLPVQQVMTGPEVDALSDQGLLLQAPAVQVFAQLTPLHKARIIEALRRAGHVVGYLGDGINDAPALQAADVGISVDTAVDIAKESADIILLNKSLTVLDRGVLEGRKVFANILKYIRMGASSNFGNMLSVLGASAWLPFLPLAAIQVLANNLLYDISQTAIPSDHVDAEELRAPRKWEMGGIGRYTVLAGPVSSLFDYLTFALMWWVLQANTVAQASLFQTGWLVESLLSQTLIIHIIRTRQVPWVQSRASWQLTVATLGVCAVGAMLPYSPLAATLGLTPLPLLYWLYMLPMLAAYLALMHLLGRWWRSLHPGSAHAGVSKTNAARSGPAHHAPSKSAK
jgi:Mg2+-importing ATPase